MGKWSRPNEMVRGHESNVPGLQESPFLFVLSPQVPPQPLSSISPQFSKTGNAGLLQGFTWVLFPLLRSPEPVQAPEALFIPTCMIPTFLPPTRTDSSSWYFTESLKFCLFYLFLHSVNVCWALQTQKLTNQTKIPALVELIFEWGWETDKYIVQGGSAIITWDKTLTLCLNNKSAESFYCPNMWEKMKAQTILSHRESYEYLHNLGTKKISVITLPGQRVIR